MIDELRVLVEKQIESGGCEENIQALTLKLIADENFNKLPDTVQDAIYQLDMCDVNELEKEEYQELLAALNS